MVMVWLAATATVGKVNVAEVWPKGMVTVEGGWAPVWSADSFTTAPPEGAADVSVTWAWTEVPPETAEGVSARAERLGPVVELTISSALREVPFADAVMVAGPAPVVVV